MSIFFRARTAGVDFEITEKDRSFAGRTGWAWRGEKKANLQALFRLMADAGM
jgi:hypothetical protein